MKITTKFNLVLFTVFTLSLGVIGYLSYEVLKKNTRDEVMQHAGMMLESAMAVRSYTVKEIRPLLQDQMAHEFLPQTVPAYAATQSFNKLRTLHPEYSYKEATLNPTNLRDRAVDWEADIIREFQANMERPEISGIRETPTGKTLYLARPIHIKNAGCLTCHGVVSDAPETLLARYGKNNGFGWKMNEVVGAQIVTVPMSYPIQKAKEAFITFMASVAGVYLFVVFVLNWMLRKLFIKPVVKMSEIANQISMGNMSAPEFKEGGKDEISVLATSFNRMRRSLVKAISLIEKNTTRSTQSTGRSNR